MHQSFRRKSLQRLSVIWMLVAAFYIAGCDKPSQEKTSSENVTKLTLWGHAGQEGERQVLQNQIDRFNEQSTALRIKLTFIPERDYNAQVQAAAIAGDLPDILEFDGPYLYNYIWQGHLRPLDDLLSKEIIDDLLPSIIDQGTHNGRLYTIGSFDSGLGLYGLKNKLEKIGARLPDSAADAWTVEEFETILDQLAEEDADRTVLDLKLNYGGEWFTYGFSPVLQSAGADLIDRSTYQRSSGTLNSPQAIAAMQHLQGWINNGYVDPNLDDAAFINNRVALSWVGHWEWTRYREAHGDNLVLLPLPDFGQGSKTGQGSWNWGITRYCSAPEQAASFLAFLLQPAEILAMTNTNGAVPASRQAIAQSDLYGADGPLRLFARQLVEGHSVPRPKTPAYPVITTQFQRAFQSIRNNGEVKQALDSAARQIDQDIRDNHGYPFKEQ